MIGTLLIIDTLHLASITMQIDYFWATKSFDKEPRCFSMRFCPFFGLWGGPPLFEMGGMVVLDTEEGG